MNTTINHELCTYSADGGKTYCGLGRGNHLYADHFFRQGEPESEFNEVFQQLESPDYPVTCNECGTEGTNASLEEHVCAGGRLWTLEHTATSMRGTKTLFFKSTPVAIVCTDTTTDHQRALDLTAALNQHSTLVAQRDRLLVAARSLLDAVFNDGKQPNVWVQIQQSAIEELRAAITAIEREG